MDPLEFLQTCDRLAASSPRPESDNRTILSRLYYAFFLTLLDGIAAKDTGFRSNVKRSGSDHALVRDYLKGVRRTPQGARNPHGPRVTWYAIYDAMYTWRELADYEIERGPDQMAAKADELLADARDLKPLVESFVR